MHAVHDAREYAGAMTSAATETAPHALPRIGIVLVAAGSGERLGAQIPKAFVALGEQPLLAHCIATVTALPHAGHLVLVVPDSHASTALALAEESRSGIGQWAISVSPGGRERHESVRFGLEALPEHVDIVLIHDAARPLTPAAQFERVIAEVEQRHCAVIPALPVADTLKRVDAARVVHETVDRASLVSVQTPQGFPRDLIVAAHDEMRVQTSNRAHEAIIPTDDAEVVQRAGGTVRVVDGDIRAHKITTPGDLLLLEGMHAAATRTKESAQ